MLYSCSTSLILIITCVLFHYEALRFIGTYAARVEQHRRAVLVVIFGVVAAHLAEILLYALAMYLGHTLGLGALASASHPRAAQYFYLSAETFTTLGLGDIYPTGDRDAADWLVGVLYLLGGTARLGRSATPGPGGTYY